MRVTKNKTLMAIFAVMLIGIAGVHVAAVTESAPEPAESESRLVAVYEVSPLEACTWGTPAGFSSSAVPSLRAENLVAPLEQRGGLHI